MAATSTEQAVLNLFTQQNKPFSVQNLVDLLAHAGHKKAPITKALDALTESGKILAKEFGKTKIYLPNQSGFAVLSKEEHDDKKQKLAAVAKQVQEQQEACKKLEQELSGFKNCMPVEDMQKEIATLKSKLPGLLSKVQDLKGGAVLVSAADREQAEKKLHVALDEWRKRKSIFRNVWCAISESMEGRKEADVFDEIGVDTDESVGASIKDLDALLPSGKSRAGPPLKKARA